MRGALESDSLICMVGTDHGLASADVRSAFSLPADVREAVLSLARAKLGATGVVLLATCNRTELWASFDAAAPPARAVDAAGVPAPEDPLLQAICDMHMVDAQDYARYFVCRSGEAAVDHLFNVACGLRSAIMAEDQVVSQVKQAIAFSRERGVADSVLEVLFRQAVTAAKQVKSGVRFTRAYATAIDQAVEMLESRGFDFGRATCMVIGNGEYGRLAATTLVERGARVIVTVRQYTHGAVAVPRGCTGVPYAERYDYLGSCDVVMSATTSPHYTLVRARLEEALGLREALGASGNGEAGDRRGALSTSVEVGTHAGSDAPGERGANGAGEGGEAPAASEALASNRKLALFDLAIPCDIDPAIAEVAGCERFDIDSFSAHIGSENKQAIVAAQRMLESGMADFWDWVHRRATMVQERPPAAALFPLFFDISEKHVVFVGGGTIALRRVRTLLPFVDDITVFAPDFSPELERFAADGAVRLVRKPYDPSVLDGADMVFACTNSRELNDEVWAECKRRNVLVNVCSDRFKCDFHFPGVAVHENMVVGVSAGGKDHRRVKQLRARIEHLMEEEGI